MTEEKTIKKIRSGLFDRGFSLTKLAVQSSAHLAMSGLRGAFQGAEARDQQLRLLMASQARLLSHELGRMKGSLMKVGQMLALYGEHFLPEEVVHQLKALNERSIAVDWPEIEKLLRQRLPAEVLAELEIETKALAAASMGQVHRARIKKSGEEICLKIQYPGVDQAIDSDIRALRHILGILKVMPAKSQAFEALFDEIREMLHQELDYESELRFTEEARDMLRDDPRFIIPTTFPRYSGPKVIATSFESGFNLDSPEVRALSEERRGRLGEAYSELFLQELFTHRMMQTDPHFGNYKVRIGDEDDKLVLLDWGAVRRFPKDFVDTYESMVEGAIAGDHGKIIEAGMAIGFLHPDDAERLKESFAAICDAAVEPWLSPRDPRVPAPLVDGKGCYIWSKSDLPSRVTAMAARYALSFKMRPPPREVLFLDRKIGGVFIVLKVLDARFKTDHLLARFFHSHRSGQGG